MHVMQLVGSRVKEKTLWQLTSRDSSVVVFCFDFHVDFFLIIILNEFKCILYNKCDENPTKKKI